MEQNKIDMFVASMNEKFPAEKMMLIRERLSKISDDRLPVLQSIDYKNPTTMFIVSFFLGGLGVDRFMLGETGLGVAKLLTCGGAGIWALIDLFVIMKKAKEWNYNKFNELAS